MYVQSRIYSVVLHLSFFNPARISLDKARQMYWGKRTWYLSLVPSAWLLILSAAALYCTGQEFLFSMWRDHPARRILRLQSTTRLDRQGGVVRIMKIASIGHDIQYVYLICLFCFTCWRATKGIRLRTQSDSWTYIRSDLMLCENISNDG